MVVVPASFPADRPVPGASLAARLAVWSAPAALGVLYAQRIGSQDTTPVPTWKLMAIALATWYVWVAFTPWVERLADRWALRRHVVRHAALHLAAAVGFTALQATATAVTSALVGAAPWRAVATILPDWFIVLLPAGVVVYGAVVGFRHATVTRRRLDDRERHAEQLMLALRDAQLGALRAQLQPHFLFNTLTAITALVRDGEMARAATALEQLSALLRDALRASEVHEVPLRDELVRVRQYLPIEELRLGHPIRLSLDVAPAALDALVPSWILQPLVENSVRHGFRGRAAPGALAIVATVIDGRLQVRIADDGAGLAGDWERRAAQGHGLANSRARLAVLHGDAAALDVAPADPHGATVTVTLPVRRAA